MLESKFHWRRVDNITDYWFKKSLCIHAATAEKGSQREGREPERETGTIKSKNTEEGYGKIWVRQRKTGKAQCKSECVNMYRPNLIIPCPPWACDQMLD